MSIVRFATLCDHCGAKSNEYVAWPSCCECLEDVCPACYVADSLLEESNRVLCATCVGLSRRMSEHCASCGKTAEVRHCGFCWDCFKRTSEKPPACEVGQCFFLASINLGGKWVCEHHAPAEAAYYGKHGNPYRAPAPPETK
jgi:hypothetical protein